MGMIRTSLSLRPLASSAVTANQIRRSLAWAATTQRQPLAFFQLVRASASTNCSSWRRWSHNQASGTEQEPEHEFVPEEHDDPEKTIYRGILSAQIKLVKSFSLMTSVIGLGCQPLIYLKVSAAGSASLPFVVAGGAFLSFFTFATPLLIHWVSKKYVTEMLYNRIENTYTAVTYSFLLRKKEITFKASEVNVPDIPGMFTTFKVNGNALFVDADSFSSAVHYGKLMGYDKPLDIRFKHNRKELEFVPPSSEKLDSSSSENKKA